MKKLLLITCLELLGFCWDFSAVAEEAPLPPHGGNKPAIDCTQCHTCPNPTVKNPCLKTCPRTIADATQSQNLGPDIVILNELEDLYVPVRFNHKIHASMAAMGESCKACHHFQAGNREKPSSCKTCHPKEIIHENLAQPGLKGSYHRQCLGCHTHWDRDTACEICHEKKAGGKLQGTATTYSIHTRHQPLELKELILFKSENKDVAPVPFHHQLHATKYERDCSLCHLQQGCNACHAMGQEPHPMGNVKEADFHDKCFQCHKSDDCEHCHGKDAKIVFTHNTTGWPLKPYHAKLDCRSCHAQRGAYMKLDSRCGTCHPNGWPEDRFNHDVTGVALDETHRQAGCKDCHPQAVPAKPTCDSCHSDGRPYNKLTWIPEKKS